MCEHLKSFAWLAGRILLSLIFLLSGAMKVMNWSATADQMTAEGMVAVPFFLFGAIAFELVGGFALLFGCKTRLGALALLVFLIPVTLIFHDFWTYEGQAMQNQMQHFMKNVTIMGGLLTLAAAGAGPISFDASFEKSTATEQAAVRREDFAEVLR